MAKDKGFRRAGITAQRLHELLRYAPTTGFLHWKIRRNQIALEGSVAGHRHNSRGKIYFRVRVDNNLVMAHHLVWLMVHGEWAPDQIDHINGDGLDNRLENLRCVPQRENNKNAALRRDNKTGVSGVTVSRAGSFVASIRIDGRFTHLGTFKSLEDASKARQEAMEKHGFHHNHGRVKLQKLFSVVNGEEEQ